MSGMEVYSEVLRVVDKFPIAIYIGSLAKSDRLRSHVITRFWRIHLEVKRRVRSEALQGRLRAPSTLAKDKTGTQEVKRRLKSSRALRFRFTYSITVTIPTLHDPNREGYLRRSYSVAEPMMEQVAALQRLLECCKYDALLCIDFKNHA